MRKIAIISGTILTLLVLGALVAPGFVDWNAYRPRIAEAVRHATGRDLVISGDLKLAILPSPSLSVDGIRLASVAGAASPDLVKLAALRIHVAFAPLLSGRIEVRSITLIEPVVELEVLADGRASWRFDLPATGAASDGPPPVSLDDIAIERGTIVYRGDGTVERLERVQAKLSAQSLTGPFRASGTADLRGLPVTFQAAIGRIEDGQATSASLGLGAASADLQLTGSLRTAAAGPTFQGRVKATIGEPARLAAGFQIGALPPALSQPLAVEATVTASATAIALNDLAIQSGELRATGGLDLSLAPAKRARLALAVPRLDLDKLMPAEAAPVAPTAGTPPNLTLPASLPGAVSASVDLTVDALVYRGGIVRQARVNMTLDRGALAINQMTAQLPGGSELSAIGRLSPIAGGGAEMRFDGVVEIGSENLRVALEWLKLNPSGVPADRLRKIALKSEIAVTPREVQFTGLDLRLDASRLTGGLTLVPGARLSLGARLAIDRINLDAYRTAQPNPAGASAPSMPLAQLSALQAFDARVEIKAGQVTIEHTPLDNVVFDATLVSGKLTLTQFGIGSIAGAAAHVSGTVDASGANPAMDLNAELSARNPSGLLRLVGIAPTLSPDQLGVFAFKARLRGGLENLRVDSDLLALGGTSRLGGSFALNQAVPGFDVAFEARHPELSQLLATLALDYRPAARTLGPAALALHAKGTTAEAALSNLAVKIGAAEIAGLAKISLAAPRPRMALDLKAGVLDFDPFLPPDPAAGRQRPIGAPVPVAGQTGWSRAPLDLGALQAIDGEIALVATALAARGTRIDNADVKATLANGAFDLAKFTGTMFGGAFDAKGKLTAASSHGAELAVTLKNANLRQAARSTAQMEVVDGHLDADLAVTTRGASQADLIAGLAGKGKFAVRDGVAEGFDLPGFSARLNNLDNAVAFIGLAQTALSGGHTPFSRLDGSYVIESGVLRSTDIRLEAPAGAGRGNAVIDLPRQTIDASGEFRLTEHPKAPPVGLKLVGPLDRPQRSYELDALQGFVLQRIGDTLLRRVLPAPSSTPAAPGQSQPGQTIRPEDILRGIIKGLGN